MWELDIENVAGIRTGETTITDGLNVVQASNFRGKSSLIAAIRTVMGTTGRYEPHPLTEGESSGAVRLETSTGTYEVSLDRESGAVTRTGSPFLTDETDQACARLFAFLGESNPIRAAVRNGEDITPYLQEPLDVEKIDQQIRSLQRTRSELETEIADAQRATDRLPSIQEEITQLEGDIAELEEKREELAEEDAAKQRADTLSDRLSGKRGDLESTRARIRQLENRIERKTERIDEKRKKRENLDVPDEDGENGAVEEKDERLTELTDRINLLEDLYRANQRIIEEGDLDFVTDIERALSGDEVECWVCGQRASRDTLESRVEELGTRLAALRNEREQLQSEIETLQQRRREVREKRQERERLDRSIQQLQTDIEELTGQLERAREREEKLESEIGDLEAQVEDAADEYNEELTDIKTELRTRERELERKRDTREQLEEQKAALVSLREERGDLQEEIDRLRRRKTEIQYELKDEFDSAMADIIDRFAPGFDGAHLDVKTDATGEIESFDLRIAREGRQTSVDALSEGEVELIGVVVALAGFRAFDVDERVPVILIDGISQLASEHLRKLIGYLADASGILVTTAYPEAGEFDGQTISPDAWDVVSDVEPSIT